jgi:hypothetical protein
MKKVIITIVVGIAGLLVGLVMSNDIVRPLIAFLVPPALGVSVGSASIGAAFKVALPWAVFVSVLVSFICWFFPRSWKLATIGLLLCAATILGALELQRQQVARGVIISRDLAQENVIFVSIDSLHLGRIAVSGIVVLVGSAVMLLIWRRQKKAANHAS